MKTIIPLTAKRGDFAGQTLPVGTIVDEIIPNVDRPTRSVALRINGMNFKTEPWRVQLLVDDVPERYQNWPKRLSVAAFLEQEGFENVDEIDLTDSVIPALCADGCEVEPDGYCPHGHPAVTMALGII